MSEENNEKVVQESFEEGVKHIGSWIVKNLPIIFSILISCFFIFSGAVKITETNLSIKTQIIMAVINVIAGWSITTLIGELGFSGAKETTSYKTEKNEYEKVVKQALKYRLAIEELSKDRSKENQIDYRIQICENANLYYWDIFDKDGYKKKDFNIRDYKKDKDYSRKKKAYKKAINVTIIKVNVFGKASSSTYGIKAEVTEAQYKAKKGTIRMVTKILLGVLSVGIMFSFVGLTWGSIIYSFMQVVLWLGMGLIDRIKNFNFVIEELMPQFTKRRLIIQSFLDMSEAEKQNYIQRAESRKQLSTTGMLEDKSKQEDIKYAK